MVAATSLQDFCFQGDSGMRQGEPLPAVIYNEMLSRGQTSDSATETILGKGQVFNSTTLFDKWDVYKILHGFEKLQPILPNTKELVVDELPELLRNMGTQTAIGTVGTGLYQLKLQGDFVVISSGMNLPLPLPAAWYLGSCCSIDGASRILFSLCTTAVYDGGLFDVRLVVRRISTGRG